MDIQNIFHGVQVEDNLQTPNENDTSAKSDAENDVGTKIKDTQTLSNLIIIICFSLFLVLCWVVVSLLLFNADVTKLLMTGNLSAIEENQGRALLGLFNPFIGIFSALALFFLTVVYNTWSKNENSKKLSEINENIKDIKNRIS